MKDKIRNSLKYSFIDGTFFAVMFGFGDTYFSPYAILLKASIFQIGLLSSLPGLVSALLQLRTPDWTDRIGRYRIMKWGVFAQVLLWLPIILIPFLFPANPVPWLILAVTLYLLSSGLAGPAWGSIMSQYLPSKKRGQYFSWRQRIHGIIGMLATFGAGLVLQSFPRRSVYGFTLLFSVAMVMRFFSWYSLSKMYEPRLAIKPGSRFTLWDFLSRIRESNFAKFVFFVGSISFAVNLAGPFFSVYMLRELKFDYLSFTIINIAPALATLVSLPAWGKHADRVGNMRIIRLSSLLLPLISILWLFSTSKVYLLLINLFSGFAWAGFNLAVSNFIYDAVSEEKRVRCIAYFNLINGIGVFCGATLGGLLTPHLPKLLGSCLLTIFLISGVMRFVFRSIFLPKLHEVKPVEKIQTPDLLCGVLGIKPMVDSVRHALRVQ
jgi:MFS family permease